MHFNNCTVAREHTMNAMNWEGLLGSMCDEIFVSINQVKIEFGIYP